MKAALRIADVIDSLNEFAGRAAAVVTILMVLVGAYNAVVRYLGRYIGVTLASNVYIELQWYMFSIVFLLGAAYTLKHGGHVRVDAIYGRLSKRPRAWINLVGTFVFLIPFSIVGIFLSWPSVRNSWQLLEMSPDPGGLPRYPIRTVVLLAFVLLLAQAVSLAIRQAAWLRGRAEDTGESETRVEGV